MTAERAPAKLSVRTARPRDAENIASLIGRVYPKILSYGASVVRGQIASFPEGQFVVEYEGTVVGYAATFVIDEATAMSRHTWPEITGNGYAARHDPKGNWLYGMEVCVDPTLRGLRIGQRLYDARKRLAETLNLKGIVFGGRIPGFSRRKRNFPTPEAYLDAVVARKARDPVIQFQRRNGFEPIGVLRDYLPGDTESENHAAHMVWRNPYADPELRNEPASGRDPEAVRVAAVQFQQRNVGSFDEFMRNVAYFVDVATDRQADFVVFPERFTAALLSMEDRPLRPMAAIERLAEHTQRFVEAMSELAIAYNVNIVGGSHPTHNAAGDIENVAYFFARDGSVVAQEKIHPSRDEKYWWNIVGGQNAATIDTDCGPVGILTGYDIEFPELARKMVDEGARILFVPFSAESRDIYQRMRYCAHARAIENQCYVVMAGNVGNLPEIENMDLQYAGSCILTPCDYRFGRDGIANEASENIETVVLADLDLLDLAWVRTDGTDRHLKDRRFDLYSIAWQRKR